MKPKVRNLLILALFALALTPVIWGVPYYGGIYAAMEPYHVEGLGISWLGAYVLANLCAPGFMQGGMGDRKEYEQGGPRSIITLYLSVMMIMFVALSVVFFVLWCVGWLLFFLEWVFAWVFYSIVDSLPFL